MANAVSAQILSQGHARDADLLGCKTLRTEPIEVESLLAGLRFTLNQGRAEYLALTDQDESILVARGGLPEQFTHAIDHWRGVCRVENGAEMRSAKEVA
jgi:hypothetical protein